jgi:hypothetical protein
MDSAKYPVVGYDAVNSVLVSFWTPPDWLLRLAKDIPMTTNYPLLPL